jgi:cupin superfamily acireductone dioxygenase involved in methionine salvage
MKKSVTFLLDLDTLIFETEKTNGSELDAQKEVIFINEDMIILPCGSYHRFILDETNYIHAMRLFKDDPKWTPVNRTEETDENPFRKAYLSSLETSKVSKKVKVNHEIEEKLSVVETIQPEIAPVAKSAEE